MVVELDPDENIFYLSGVRENKHLLKTSDMIFFNAASRPEFWQVPQLFEEQKMDGYFLNVVFQQALILSLIGYIPGFSVAKVLYVATQNATSLPIIMNTGKGDRFPPIFSQPHSIKEIFSVSS